MALGLSYTGEVTIEVPPFLTPLEVRLYVETIFASAHEPALFLVVVAAVTVAFLLSRD